MNTQYDVFISFKHLDSSGQQTDDCSLAQLVYDYLSSRDLNVFFSQVTLESMGIAEYKRFIDNALDEAPVLIAVGTSRENLESQWVRYEWDGFYQDILNGYKQNAKLFSYISGLETTDLPRTLRHTQCFVHAEDSLERLYSFLMNALQSKPIKAKNNLKYERIGLPNDTKIGAITTSGTRGFEIIPFSGKREALRVDAIIVEEDTFMVLNPKGKTDTSKRTTESIKKKLQSNFPLRPGTVVIRKNTEPAELIAIVYNFDEEPPVKEECIVEALEQAVEKINSAGWQSIAICPLGSRFGHISSSSCRQIIEECIGKNQFETLQKIYLL